jgi:hypothetical protein
LSRTHDESGRLPIPVESAMSRDVRLVKNAGKTQRGLDAISNSSRFSHEARAIGTAFKKLAEMSSASRVLHICGKAPNRKVGSIPGVLDDPRSRCVVPDQGSVMSWMKLCHE